MRPRKIVSLRWPVDLLRYTRREAKAAELDWSAYVIGIVERRAPEKPGTVGEATARLRTEVAALEDHADKIHQALDGVEDAARVALPDIGRKPT